MTRISLCLFSLLSAAHLSHAFVTRSLPTFFRSMTSNRASLTMDMEGAENSHMFRPRHEEKLKISLAPLIASTTSQQQNVQQLDKVQAALGMPWKSCIQGDGMLTYMPFWEWQIEFLKNNLTNLRVVSCTDHTGSQDFSLNENSKKGARIVNICLACDEYHRIRMTYYDAGDKTQVFNSLWYPNPCYNLPVLGIDLLQFNRKKHLAVVDFQPIQHEHDEHAMPFEHLIEPIRDLYPSLQGRMSARFYDETQFFSKQMLFARFDQQEVVNRDLFPAFQSYVQQHVNLVKSTPPNLACMEQVLERQAAYDVYSAERDPATAMFEAMFGEEWADSFVHEFLFSLSR